MSTKKTSRSRTLNVDEAIPRMLGGGTASAEMLRLVDEYIRMKERVGVGFQLPFDHRHLDPTIKKYSNDLPAFVEYVRGIRDNMRGHDSSAYVSLHELYRKLEVRLVQQQRRERAHRALVWFEKKYPRATLEQKQKWIRKVEQTWGRRRMAAMNDHRKTLKDRTRLTDAERAELLQDFWIDIECEIKQGLLPPL
jgi:hypothetical protein